MKKIVLLIITILILGFIGCSDNSNTEEVKVNKELKETANNKVKEITGMTSAEISNEAAKIKVSKKYPVKSGIITFKRSGVIGDQKIVVYFDNYGIKERNETYNPKGEIEEIRFSDGDKIYLINYKYNKNKVAYIMGPAVMGTEMKFVPEPFRSDEQKNRYKYEKLSNMNILGKDCEAYRTNLHNNETTYAGWNGILLYSKVKMPIGVTEKKAVDFKEGVDVDQALFTVPQDYKIKKYNQ